MSETEKGALRDPARREFLGAAMLGTGAVALAGSAARPAMAAEAGPDGPPPQVQFPDNPRMFGGGPPGSNNRAEIDLFDCEVEGELPTDLDGVFYRVGPDPQYPKPPEHAADIVFDGEGHVSMFRIRNGRVSYRTRYAKNARWKAQNEAGRSLFGMYRNPYTDDPSVKGLNRGTANTQLFVHHGKLLVFKEDSPPVEMHPLTLETLDEEYTFGGKLESLTHTAHPKIDPVTGEFVSFGYEATGFLSKDVNVFSADRNGNITWSVTVAAPYAGMMHDFAVTQDYIVLYVTNMIADANRIRAGGVHFSYDANTPCYMGVLRRGGDGRDIRWFTGESLFCTHVMGAWNDGEKIVSDWDGGEGNQFPFFPSLQGGFDPVAATGRIRRFTIDLSRPSTDHFEVETLYPEVTGVLSRQDDRHHTLPYRYGFLNEMGPEGKWVIIDHSTGATKKAAVPGYSLSEMCFVPRRKDAPEGDGYLIGIGASLRENGRSDVMLFDLDDVDAGPIARIRMPFKCVGQVHGFWADASEIPGASEA